MTEREPEQVAFEGQVVRATRRRIDPLRIGVVIAVVGLAAAYIKPWDGLTQTTEPAPGPAAIASLAPHVPDPTDTRVLPRPSTPVDGDVTTGPIDWATAATVVEPHDRWGVRTIVRAFGPDDGSEDDLVERWTATTSPDAAAPIVTMPAEDPATLAIGITFPPASTPVDVRVRRETEDHTWEWVDARPLDADPAGGAFLFAPPPVDGRAVSGWPSGAYRFDVLGGGHIASIEVHLPGRFGRIPLSAIAPRDKALAAPLPVDLSAIDPGAFVVVDGKAVPVGARDTTTVLDPAAAWLDVIGRPGTLEPTGPPAGLVGDAYVPGANGIGVLLPSGADDLRATLRRIDIDGETTEPIRPEGTFTSIGTGITPYAVFAAPDGQAFTPGLYAIESSWRDGTGNISRVDHIELLPGPTVHGSRLLDAARSVLDDQGGVRPALLLFTKDRLGWLPVTTDGGADRDLFDGAGCETPAPGLDTGSTYLLAFAGGPAAATHQIRIRSIVAGGRQTEVPLLVSRDVVPGDDPGLTLVAPADGEVFGSGVYRVTIGTGSDTRTGTLCFGPLVYQ